MSTENKPAIDPKAYETRIPRNVYKLRVREATNAKTKDIGNRMFKYVSEIIPREEGKPTIVNGVCIDGLEFYHQSVITEKALKFVNQFRGAVGLNDLTIEDMDSANAEDAKGLEFFAECFGKEETKVNEVTGEPLIDPFNDKPVKMLTREIVQFFVRPKN